MPLTGNELQRLADAAQALRPGWPARSVRAVLERTVRGRAFADTAVALAIVATDERIDTPAVLGEHGPWWTAADRAGRRAETVPHIGPRPGSQQCQVYGHEREEAPVCRLCAADRLAVLPDEDEGPMCGAAHPTLTDVACWATAAGHRLHRGVAWHGGTTQIVSWPVQDVETPQEVSAP
jgi:hypothetical protein